VNEQELRRHLDEAHRQLLERDKLYRVHEDELRSRDLQIEQLRERLAETQGWAQELEAGMQEVQVTRAWRFAVWFRTVRAGARGLVGPGR
jgi:hypothetical protein